MTSSIFRLAVSALCLTSLAAFGVAQREGDLLVTGSGTYAGAHSLEWNTGILTPIGNLRRNMASVHTGYGNTYAWSTGLSDGYVYRNVPGGSTSTMVRLPSNTLHGGCVDQDGTFVVAGYSTGRIYRVGTSTYSTVSTLSNVYSIARDWKSGDLLAAVYNSQFGQLTQVDRNTGRQSTLVWSTALSHVYSAVTVPSNNFSFFVGCMRPNDGLMIVRRDGSVALTLDIPYIRAVTFDQRRNRVFAASRASNLGRIYEMTPLGVVLAVRTFTASHDWRGIDVYGDKQVSVSTTGGRGQEVTVRLNFSESPSAYYSAAIASGIGNTLRIAGNHQHIALDTLFFLTAGGGLPLFTRNFSGFLDANGVGSAYFTLPNGPTRGIPLYVTASAFNPAKPGGIDLGNTEVVKIY